MKALICSIAVGTVSLLEAIRFLRRPVRFYQASSSETCIEAIFAALDLDWREHVVGDPSLFRPADIDWSEGDPRRAAQMLGWEATVRMPTLAGKRVAAAQAEPAGQ